MADDNGKIIVKVDADIEDLIPEYLEMTRDDVSALRGALDTGDYDALRIKGHTLKGSGGGYGFDYITEIGANIEDLAKARSHDGISRWVSELESYLDRVVVEFE